MEDLSRSEYPAMLASLQPSAAVHAFTERVKRIARQNQEIADWLQERRRVEDAYISGLRKLLLFKVPNDQSELGIFQTPWDKILQSADAIAASHQLYARNVEKDVEHALRSFQNRREMQSINTISANLQSMARELDEAQERSDKLSRKGGKANAQKVDQATSRLEAAQQQWDSQAPFIFESLQALDEQRINHLRDVLTQLVTHEVDQAARTQASAEDVLNTLLEVQTDREIKSFAQRTTAGRPKLEKRATSTRQGSVVPTPSLAPPSLSGHRDDDDGVSEHSGFREKDQGESKLRSRIGTMLGRRRQSVHGGFGPLSPQKNLGSFTRNLNSSHGRGISPRGSSHNLAESHNRLSSLSESPTSGPQESTNHAEQHPHEGTNGFKTGDGTNAASQQPAGVLNGTAEDIFDVQPPPGPPPSQLHNQEPAKDSDGYTVPAPMNDPISQAQKEAAAEGGEDGNQFFKVNIQKEPVLEEDPDAKQAALSNVAKSLTQMGAPTRKTGTIRGRRDVRNTVYMPSLSASGSIPEDTPAPSSPALPSVSSRPSAVSALASETSIGGTSDTQSVRSGLSLGSQTQHKHPEMHGTGLNTSIIEYVSASFEDGVVKAAKINGEIAFAYNPDPSSSNPEHLTIRINNFNALSAIGPNRILVNNVSSSPDQFSLDLSHLAKPSPSFTYRLQADDDPTALASHCPLVIKPSWKPTGDKLGLVLQYRLNPDSKFPAPATLHNVFIFATYEGARASGAQSKPASIHLKDKHIVYWKLGDITLTEDWSKILCRIVGEGGAEPKPGHVEARWEYAVPEQPEGAAAAIGSGISISRLLEPKGKERAVEEEEDDPFSDDMGRSTPSPRSAGTWADVPAVRKLASGKYEAK
ncbi:putative suppressor of profilin protein [Coniochaeta ligniaria NRRL 30616]|uniref:Putative suppressor of profilin protein n=1 Tax=Coniochaeta ligniaria NRRL 30616 TaxID=1408157 RepID=A0A1J7ILA3_9PEZI|nr:putative suppressor of profilin protein [Coniochaeta ligniaria NRRL 30616]